MYIKITNDQPEIYTIRQLRLDNPNMSFPSVIPEERLADFGIYPCVKDTVPDYDPVTHTIVNGTPTNVDGVWRLPINVAPLPVDIAASNIRAKRDEMLRDTDYTQLSDSPQNGVEWATYRQALRDIPQQPGFPTDVIWPTKPENV